MNIDLYIFVKLEIVILSGQILIKSIKIHLSRTFLYAWFHI